MKVLHMKLDQVQRHTRSSDLACVRPKAKRETHKVSRFISTYLE